MNFTVRSGPAEYAAARHFHGYVSVIPRLTRVAGFELGSGMFIHTVLPEAAAEFLRKVSVDKVAGAAAGQWEFGESAARAFWACDVFLASLRG